LLARHFLRKYAEKAKKDIVGFSPAAFKKLMIHHWPGNVRELENCVESAVAMAHREVVTEEVILQGRSTGQDDGPKSFKDAKVDFEKEYLIQLLQITKGNVTEAGKLAGKHRADLYELLRKHDLDPKAFRKSDSGS